ncbi:MULTISPECIES: ANTAR domain-containing response regulator [unclassified Modestobacter]|uniref:ANTAR domain-containing response regulator n=1 Tax=unclassified Modestobacter TaxID=2643866 RepID=UPI0022AA7400|nr:MULTISPECIES: ANTAR domain-containing protein [unclassified Modestobacter]MCZ2823873.1 ANTAR domain-containing protein [Modestobacter sp. VKM Ac-2981]MCZ2852118.1 ANTAR domain-containing protein [Modestobacter sp. VKM Ac-2982]
MTGAPLPGSWPVSVALPTDVLVGPSGGPAALVVRTRRGWSVLSPLPSFGDVLGGSVGDSAAGWGERVDGLALIEAMTLADLVAGELGATPEPDRQARRAARTAGPSATAETCAAASDDPRAEEVAALRRTVSQLEHALAARVSIERAIGVLAERHGTTPRAAFEELRRQARSQGRPAAELAAEVLDALPTRDVVSGAPS